MKLYFDTIGSYLCEMREPWPGDLSGDPELDMWPKMEARLLSSSSLISDMLQHIIIIIIIIISIIIWISDILQFIIIIIIIKDL